MHGLGTTQLGVKLETMSGLINLQMGVCWKVFFDSIEAVSSFCVRSKQTFTLDQLFANSFV